MGTVKPVPSPSVAIAVETQWRDPGYGPGRRTGQRARVRRTLWGECPQFASRSSPGYWVPGSREAPVLPWYTTLVYHTGVPPLGAPNACPAHATPSVGEELGGLGPLWRIDVA